MKPFLTNNGYLDNSDIMLKGDNEIIVDWQIFLQSY